MTTEYRQTNQENVLRGSLLALIAIPVGVALFTLISTIGIYASITGFVIAYVAVWLYGRGSRGIITRVGAWIVTAIVVVTLLLSFYVSVVFEFARVVAKEGHMDLLSVFGRAEFWPLANRFFQVELPHNLLPFGLAIALGLLGSFRTLRRAFATSSLHTPPTPEGFVGAGMPSAGEPRAGTLPQTTANPTVTPTEYRNDIDGAPTGSADDKTAPPSAS